MYEPVELLTDGYPRAWARCQRCGGQDLDCPICYGEGSVKDLVRTLAGNRCVRCQHPYTVGAHASVMDERLGVWKNWSPCDGRCTHDGPIRWRSPGRLEWIEDGEATTMTKRGVEELLARGAEVEALWRILTVHHLRDGREWRADCRWWHIVPLCQRCHLRIQRVVIMNRVYPFEHTGWFRPYAAGWYAWTYLGEELSRSEVAAREDELLALERMA